VNLKLQLRIKLLMKLHLSNCSKDQPNKGTNQIIMEWSRAICQSYKVNPHQSRKLLPVPIA